MRPHIVSFRRSGYNLLANLLHSNLNTGLASYEELHFSHTKKPTEPYIAVVRALLPTMVSFYKLKGRFGIADCSFAHFIRTPQKYLETTKHWAGSYNGQMRQDVAPLPTTYDALALPVQWAKLTCNFADGAHVCFAYHDIVNRPVAVVNKVAEAFKLRRKLEFSSVLERVGWTPDSGIQVNVSPADYQHLQEIEDTVDAHRTRYRF